MSYISTLNLLGGESPGDISEEALTEELSLWANAQFTFDTEPGSALLDDLHEKPTQQHNHHQQHQQQHQHPSHSADLLAALTDSDGKPSLSYAFSA